MRAYISSFYVYVYVIERFLCLFTTQTMQKTARHTAHDAVYALGKRIANAHSGKTIPNDETMQTNAKTIIKAQTAKHRIKQGKKKGLLSETFSPPSAAPK